MISDPGQLREYLSIQVPVETNTAGEVATAWRTVSHAYARVSQGGGREFFRAQQVNADMTHLVEMRAYDDLTTRHRFLWGSRVLNIDAISDPDGLGSWQTVQCREVV